MESREVVWEKSCEDSRRLEFRLVPATVTVWRNERLHEVQSRTQNLIQSDGPVARGRWEMPSGQSMEISTKVRIGQSCGDIVVVGMAQLEERIVVPDATQEGLVLPLLAGRFV
jgi:hypothetical protein